MLFGGVRIDKRMYLNNRKHHVDSVRITCLDHLGSFQKCHQPCEAPIQYSDIHLHFVPRVERMRINFHIATPKIRMAPR